MHLQGVASPSASPLCTPKVTSLLTPKALQKTARVAAQRLPRVRGFPTATYPERVENPTFDHQTGGARRPAAIATFRGPMNWISKPWCVESE